MRSSVRVLRAPASSESPDDGRAHGRDGRLPGLVLGGLGVLGFSFTLPATRVAVAQLGGPFVGLGRALVAAGLAAAVLLVRRERPPARRHWGSLAIVVLGVVIGFPLFSALALRWVSAAHSAVIVGLLPAATAGMAVLRAGERPTLGFWLAGVVGLIAVLGFAATQGAGRPQPADALVLMAVALGGLGYAEGGALARELGGWRVICWALILAAPLVAPVVVVLAARSGLAAGPGAWLGFAYVSVVSMFLGFFAWYQGLALGGIARVSQLQLAQPVLTIAWAALLLHESVGPGTVLAALFVLASVAASQRTRVGRATVPLPSGPSAASVATED